MPSLTVYSVESEYFTTTVSDGESKPYSPLSPSSSRLATTEDTADTIELIFV